MDSVESVAIIVNPRDNVATARVPLASGVELEHGGQTIKIRQDIPFGHKFALCCIRAGDSVIKFGDPIGGVTEDVGVGDWVHTHNLVSRRGKSGRIDGRAAAGARRACPQEVASLASCPSQEVDSPAQRPSSSVPRVSGERLTFLGFRRPDGSVGVRNHLVVLPSVACASHVAELIAGEVEGAVAIPNQHGCSQIGADREQTFRTLVGTAVNPNVGAALVVGLGCETISAEDIAQEITRLGRPVDEVSIQDLGGTGNAFEAGVRKAREMMEQIRYLEREPVPLGELVLGTECGGSDTSSGFSANPAVGYAADLLVQQGGTVILSETTEFIGAEHLLRGRAINERVGDCLVDMVRKVERSAIDMGVDILGANPSPGNMAGGISTIEEKSLGCIYKSGTAPISGVFGYGERVRGPGLVIMDTPGNDPVSITGMAAGGAHLVVFTTGRGTPAGSPVLPVIKIATNSGLFARMRDNIDISAGTIIDGEETIRAVGCGIFDTIVSVASGQPTKAEHWGHREFSIGRLAPTF